MLLCLKSDTFLGVSLQIIYVLFWDYLYLQAKGTGNGAQKN